MRIFEETLDRKALAAPSTTSFEKVAANRTAASSHPSTYRPRQRLHLRCGTAMVSHNTIGFMNGLRHHRIEAPTLALVEVQEAGAARGP